MMSAQEYCMKMECHLREGVYAKYNTGLKRVNLNIILYISWCYPSRHWLVQSFKVDNGNTRTLREICSKLKIEVQERHRRCSGVFVVKSEQISHIVLMRL